MSKFKILPTVSVGFVILGFTMFPFIDWAIQGISIEPAPAMKNPALWIYPILAVITLFIHGKASGWSRIAAGVIGIGILVSEGLRSMSIITESASMGFIGRTAIDVMSGNTPVQVIEKLTFGSGFYISVIGLMVLAASGIWEIIESRKSQNSVPTEN